MYCPNCGAKLGDGEIKCPLCLTKQPSPEGKPLYPSKARPRDKEDFRGLLFALTLFILSIGGSVLAMDLTDGQGVSYSPYVLLGLAVFYAAFFLPRWWKRPNPVIFLPIFFAVVFSLLLYVDLATQGGWFLTFVLPVFGGCSLFTVAAAALIRYVRKGKLYIFGGLFLSFAVLSFVGEILFRVTFHLPIRLSFSLVPLILFASWGMGLIVIAIVRPFRRWFERRFFI